MKYFKFKNLNWHQNWHSHHRLFYGLCFVLGIFWNTSILSTQVFHNFETTRMKSLSGAGVGSILLDEAPILNPASTAFFKDSSIVYHQGKGEYTAKEPLIPTLPDSKARGFFLADGGESGLSGNLFYTDVEDGFSTRKQYGVSFSGAVNSKAAMGFTYRETKDSLKTSSNDTARNEKYQQTVLGTSYVYDTNMSFGVVLIDPFKSHSKDSRGFLGFQYNFQSPIAIIGDVGSRWDQNLSDYLVYRGGLQIAFYNDFFLRAGVFRDKGFSERGNSVGVSWIQPRLSLEFAIKNTKVLTDSRTHQRSYDLKESSFGVGYRF